MKGQTLIIQFVLFFIIGFSLFTSIAVFFKYQSDIFKNDITNYNIQLINSYFSATAISAAVTCKTCDFVNITTTTQNTTAGYFFEVGMTNLGLNTTVPMAQQRVTSSVYNLNSSYVLSGFSPSIKPITITFNKIQNSLGVS
jgi:hypothetical protein